MNRLDCEHCGAELSALVDGELDAARQAQVEAHLLECSACRTLLADLRRISADLASLPRMSAPPQLAPAMRRAAERRLILSEPSPPHVLRYRWAARIIASAALVGMCVLASWQMWGRERPAAPHTGHEIVLRDHQPEPTPREPPELNLSRGRGEGGTSELEELTNSRFYRSRGRSDDLRRAVGGAPPATASGDARDLDARVAGEPRILDSPESAGDVAAERSRESPPELFGAAAPDTLQVVIEPRDEAEATAVRQFLAEWTIAQQSALTTSGRSPGLGGGAGAELSPVDSLKSAEVQAPPEQARVLIAELERRAPQRVRLGATLSQLEQVVGRGPVLRSAGSPEGGELAAREPAAHKRAPSQTEPSAGRLGAPVTEARDAPAANEHAAVRETAESMDRRGTGAARLRQRAVATPAATPQPTTGESGGRAGRRSDEAQRPLAAGQEVQSTPGAPRTIPTIVGEQFGRMLTALVDAVSPGSAPAPPPPPQMRLQIELRPPAQSALAPTTQSSQRP